MGPKFVTRAPPYARGLKKRPSYYRVYPTILGLVGRDVYDQTQLRPETPAASGNGRRKASCFPGTHTHTTTF